MPTPGKPLFQAATANQNPSSEAKVDTDNPGGPLLIISGEKDHIAPPVVANAFSKQQDNQGVTEIIEIKNRGHALTIDSSWREVADTALAFVNDSHSRAGADPSKRYAYAPTMAVHRGIGVRHPR